MRKVMVVYGTRPEGVKVAPVIQALKESKVLSPIVLSTGQHKDMLEQVNNHFGITPDVELDIFEPGQSLNQIAAKIFSKLDPVLAEYEPNALLVQGDTSTVTAASMAAFYRKIPVVHLEAGLRSGDIFSPFPEEANRKLTSQITSLHLAPTAGSKQNLLDEGVPEASIAVTGNTVIDALLYTLKQDIEVTKSELAYALNSGKRILLVTSHRRENLGDPMRDIAAALQTLAQKYPDDLIVFPIHSNPKVRETFLPFLQDLENVLLMDPLDYPEFALAMKAAHIILTDSGGVQEEAPALGKPVLVMRESTERPEAVAAGTVSLIGTDMDRIVAEVSRLKEDAEAYAKMANAVNPYGDGGAAKRSAAAIEQLLGVGVRLPDFVPSSEN